MSIFSRAEADVKSLLPVAPAAAPVLTQADRIEDKLDYLIKELSTVKTITVGVSPDLTAQLKAVSDAMLALNAPAPVVAAPVAAPAAQ